MDLLCVGGEQGFRRLSHLCISGGQEFRRLSHLCISGGQEFRRLSHLCISGVQEFRRLSHLFISGVQGCERQVKLGLAMVPKTCNSLTEYGSLTWNTWLPVSCSHSVTGDCVEQRR